MLNPKFALKPLIIAGAAVFTVLAAPIAVDYVVADSPVVAQARAQEDGGGGSGAVNKGGHHGSRPADKGGPKWEAGSQPWPEGKGPPADSDYWSGDGRPPRYGGDPEKMRKPESSTQGGSPVWAAQELADIGRMNVARAPQSVLDRAEANALLELATNYPDFYSAAVAILVNEQTGAITADEAKTQLAALLTASGALRIDSPLANLAFYKDITTDGVITSADGTVVYFSALNPDLTVNPTLLAAYQAIFLGGASDKTKLVTADVVHAVDIIMAFEEPTPKGVTPVNLDVVQDEYLAIYADTFRTAVVVVHDGE